MLASVTETVWDCFWAEPDGKLACREAKVLFSMKNKSFFKLVTGKGDFKRARGKEGQHRTFFVEMFSSVTETIWDCFWAEPVGKLACREAIVLFFNGEQVILQASHRQSGLQTR